MVLNDAASVPVMTLSANNLLHTIVIILYDSTTYHFRA
jgi:hypothetical protein